MSDTDEQCTLSNTDHETDALEPSETGSDDEGSNDAIKVVPAANVGSKRLENEVRAYGRLSLKSKTTASTGTHLPAAMTVAPVTARKSQTIMNPTNDDEELDEASQQQLRARNITALLTNSLHTCRQPVMSKYLTLKEGEARLKRPFFSPKPGAPAVSDVLRLRLLARKRFVPWGDSKPFQPPKVPQVLNEVPLPTPEVQVEPDTLPEGTEPLVLWEPPDDAAPGSCPILVDNMLVRWLRPHQREGVQFMFECVAGLRIGNGQGCILADDMGLGKTLQGITLLWTLLRSGDALLGGVPMASRGIIVCPTSLVSNWDSECMKWLKGRVTTMPLCESSRDDVVSAITQFLHPSNPYKVLIISYETFRLHADRFKGPDACDLLICDEAHRLKNDATLTNRALGSLQCKRRVLLSGTPMQNHLDEFYAMVDFCNPGVLGTPSEFRKRFEAPILAGREPDATATCVALGEERSAELSAVVNAFIMRRTNALLSEHLPPKVIQVVCCRLTELQRVLYCHYLESKAARKLLSGRTTAVLPAITNLKKLCNHPKLIYDAVHSKAGEDAVPIEGFEHVGQLFPPGVFDNGRTGRGGMAVGWESLSGKMAVVGRMLHTLYTGGDDRIVIVSNYTQTLDLLAHLCRERSYPCLRLDGSTSISKRQKLVKLFNDPMDRQFVFLLSSKAGGCGLNLIGGNRLILFDPDWNPANDKQAAARVWRDGQKKRVFVYRLLSSGTIEEKVFQRQLSKEGLQSLVGKAGKATANLMSSEALRELFSLHADTLSDTYESMCCGSGTGDGSRCASDEAEEDFARISGDEEECHEGGQCRQWAGTGSSSRRAVSGAVGPILKEQVGHPAEEDLQAWGHHSDPSTVPDAVMQHVAGDDVSFIFSCKVDGMAVDESAPKQRIMADARAGSAGLARKSRSVGSSLHARAGNANWPATGAATPTAGQRQPPVPDIDVPITPVTMAALHVGPSGSAWSGGTAGGTAGRPVGIRQKLLAKAARAVTPQPGRLPTTTMSGSDDELN